MTEAQKTKEVTRRILMDLEPANAVDQYMIKLKEKGCKKIDASKVVNSILSIFFDRFSEPAFKEIRREFFDKKGYLIKLINDSSDDEIDTNVASYIEETKPRKRRGRKPKIKPESNCDEAKSS